MLAFAISARRTMRTARSTRSLRSSSRPRASSRAATPARSSTSWRPLLKPTAKNLPRDVALIAELLGVPADERYPALAVSPQQKREMTLTALLDQLDGAAAQSPVLIVFEDVHWIDPTSLDLLDRMVARVANLPVLLVVTFRPEFQPTWVGQPHVTMLPLSRLGRRDSAGIIAGITRDKALPDAVVEQILAHADGVPLFIEELTSTLLESGLLRETADRYVLDGPLPPLAIPTTLQASLVARLDRLGLGQGCGADRRRDRTGVLPRADRRGVGPGPDRPRRGARAADGLRPRSPGAERRRTRPTRSSTRWCRTPPTPRCSRAGGGSCMRASPRCWSSGSRRWPKACPRSSPTISPRPGLPARRSAIGSRRVGLRARGRPTARPSAPSSGRCSSSRRCRRPARGRSRPSIFASI